MLQSCFSSLSSPALQLLLGACGVIDLVVTLILIGLLCQHRKALKDVRRRLGLEQAQ